MAANAGIYGGTCVVGRLALPCDNNSFGVIVEFLGRDCPALMASCRDSCRRVCAGSNLALVAASAALCFSEYGVLAPADMAQKAKPALSSGAHHSDVHFKWHDAPPPFLYFGMEEDLEIEIPAHFGTSRDGGFIPHFMREFAVADAEFTCTVVRAAIRAKTGNTGETRVYNPLLPAASWGDRFGGDDLSEMANYSAEEDAGDCRADNLSFPRIPYTARVDPGVRYIPPSRDVDFGVCIPAVCSRTALSKPPLSAGERLEQVVRERGDTQVWALVCMLQNCNDALRFAEEGVMLIIAEYYSIDPPSDNTVTPTGETADEEYKHTDIAFAPNGTWHPVYFEDAARLHHSPPDDEAKGITSDAAANFVCPQPTNIADFINGDDEDVKTATPLWTTPELPAKIENAIPAEFLPNNGGHNTAPSHRARYASGSLKNPLQGGRMYTIIDAELDIEISGISRRDKQREVLAENRAGTVSIDDEPDSIQELLKNMLFDDVCSQTDGDDGNPVLMRRAPTVGSDGRHQVQRGKSEVTTARMCASIAM